MRAAPSAAAAALLLAALLALAAGGAAGEAGVAAAADGASCGDLLARYRAAHGAREAVPFRGGDNAMLYFLHVPRTGGRTFHTCFLKTAHAPRRRCPKAYDHLRINTALPRCYLLSSHDDFSVVSMLPEDVAVVTQMRDPVDRVLSAYEFALEVAARQAKSGAAANKARIMALPGKARWRGGAAVGVTVAAARPPRRRSRRRGRRRRAARAARLLGCTAPNTQRPLPRSRLPSDTSGMPSIQTNRRAQVVTDNVWPWSILVPFFVQDIRSRAAAVAAAGADAGGAHAAHPGAGGVWAPFKDENGRRYYYNKALNVTRWELSEEEKGAELPPLNPYDNPLAMPLAQFIEHPIAQARRRPCARGRPLPFGVLGGA
jgi:hypothetical protein